MIKSTHKMQQMQLNIAFHMMGGEGWTAGSIYLSNLFYALRQTYREEVKISLLAAPVAQNDAQSYARFIEADDIIFCTIPSMLRRWTFLWVISQAIKRIKHLSSHDRDEIMESILKKYKIDEIMESILKKHKINVVFGPLLVCKYAKIATLSWLPDFQHIHLPEMFSEAERYSRDRTFLRAAELATRIILISNTAKKDFESFTPKYAYKARALYPISYIPQSVYDYDLNSILNLYHLPEKFVYLPNQFWKHKNHEMVFQSVKILKDRGIRVFIVCTGSPSDCRHPGYFASLLLKLSQWNIRDQVIYLGLIPHEHVLLLMRQSICVLNPSLFEGWGVTVDEARSVGKQALLSDIPTHREQNPPKATFFDPYDCDDLAKKLGQLWEEIKTGPDIKLEFEARSTLPERLHTYAEAFFSVAQDAVKEIGI